MYSYPYSYYPYYYDDDYMDDMYQNMPYGMEQQPMYPQMPGAQPEMPQQQQPMVPTTPTAPDRGVNVPGLLPVEQSYIENILRLNLGKMATIYMTYEGNNEWNAKVYKGKLEAAGRDHIIISDPQTGKRYLLLMVNLDYISFDEELEYEPPRSPRRG